MGRIAKKIEQKIEEASRCRGCGHSDSQGVASCDCARGDCACSTAD